MRCGPENRKVVAFTGYVSFFETHALYLESHHSIPDSTRCGAGLSISLMLRGRARAPYAPFVSLRAKRSNPHCHAIRDCFASLAMTQRNPPFPASNPSPPRLQPAQWRTRMSARRKTLRKSEMRPKSDMNIRMDRMNKMDGKAESQSIP